jgi:hypothetical protein
VEAVTPSSAEPAEAAAAPRKRSSRRYRH